MPSPNVVDLSEYQTKTANGKMDIDFADLKANGIQAVILRLGHGNTRDNGVEHFIGQAQRAGLVIHGYHFYEAEINNQVEWSIQNAKELGLAANAYYFLDMEGKLPGNWPEIFRAFYRNWKMAGWNVGLYASLSKYSQFDLNEFKTNEVYKWVAAWDAEHAPEIADVWQYNCLTGLGKYSLKLDKDVDITGKLIQKIEAPGKLETDPDGQYKIKAGAFVGFDYSTTDIIGGKMLVSSPNGVDKIPKLGPDGSFFFNREDAHRMLPYLKDFITQQIQAARLLTWDDIKGKPDVVLRSDLPDFNQFALKKDLPAPVDLSGYAKTDTVEAVKATAESALSNAEKAQSTADANSKALSVKANKSEIPDISGLAKKSDIPSVAGLVKEAELADYAKKSDIPAPVDLSGYAKTDVVDAVKTVADKAQAIADTNSKLLETKVDRKDLPTVPTDLVHSAELDQVRIDVSQAQQDAAQAMANAKSAKATIDTSDEFTVKKPSEYSEGFSHELKQVAAMIPDRSGLDKSAQAGSIAVLSTMSYGNYARQTLKVLDSQRPMTFIRNGSGDTWYPWETVTTTITVD